MLLCNAGSQAKLFSLFPGLILSLRFSISNILYLYTDILTSCSTAREGKLHEGILFIPRLEWCLVDMGNIC